MPMTLKNRFTVLLVEDNPGDARLIEAYLQSESGERIGLRHAASLASALAELQHVRPDVVLLDLGLPDSQGFGTLDRVLAVSEDTSVVVLTGSSDEEMALEAIHRGAQDYLPKGQFDETLLVRTIRYASERKRAEEAVRRSEERYRDLFEKANEAILVTVDGFIRAANPMAETTLGMPHDALLNQPFLAHVHPDDQEMVKTYLDPQQDLDTLKERFEFRLQNRRTGETRWVRNSSKRVDWDDMVGDLHLLSDITGQKDEEQLRASMLLRQTAINNLTFSLGTTGDSSEVCRILYRHISETVDVWAMHVATIEEDGTAIFPRFAIEDGVELDLQIREAIPLSRLGCPYPAHVVRVREPLLVSEDAAASDARDCARCVMMPGGCGKLPDVSGTDEIVPPWTAVLVPMLTEGEVMGLLQIVSHRLDSFDQADVDLVAGLANVAAIALRNNQLVRESVRQARRLREAFEGIVRTVSSATETRDPYTAGHQVRVAGLSTAIAETLGLSPDMVEGVRVAATVHDIGKIGIPAEILAKPGKLSDTEFLIIQSHPENAYRILESIEFPWPIAEIVYQHHERLDGSGYPRGLRGDQINLEARILAVADVVEAMASHRPYRAALGLDCALEEIESLKGEKLDPQVVEACIALFRERGFSLDDAPEERP